MKKNVWVEIGRLYDPPKPKEEKKDNKNAQPKRGKEKQWQK